MKDLDISLESMKEAKRFSLEIKASALQQLVLQRFQALITISSISFAVTGIVISIRSGLIKNETLAFLSAGLFITIALVGLGRHLYLIRDDIKAISKQIKDLPDVDWRQPPEEKEFKADWWPEVLYVALILGTLLLSLSFFNT